MPIISQNWSSLFRKLPFYLFFSFLVLFTSKNEFFWDTIQLSAKHACHYYENGLVPSLLPNNMDSGHIPTFGYILAILWTIFGKSILVSHLYLLPFIWGIVYQADKLITYFIPRKPGIYLAAFLAGPSLLTQATLVSPEIPLMFFMLTLLNAILNMKKWLKIIGTIGLVLVSMRGMMIVLVLAVFELILVLIEKKTFRSILIQFFLYFPAGLIVLSFLIWHFLAKGWIGYHEDSPWSESFEQVDIKGFIWNIGIYSWRLIDFGRIIWWIVLLSLIPTIINYYKSNEKLRKIILLCFLFLIIFPLNMLMHKYLTQHRYFMPTYLMIALLVLYVIHEKQIQRKLIPIVIIFLLCGNFIIYPDKISKGWDTTLAHLPYYGLRRDAISYIQKECIPKHKIKSWFPNLAPEKFISLKDNDSTFSSQGIEEVDYCLYSNIYNDVNDEEYNSLFNNWEIVYKKKKMGVKIILFKKKP